MILNLETKNMPAVIGLAGKAGSGKTSVAEQICPKATIASLKSDELTAGIIWDHIFYALPLYEMFVIKGTIRGLNEKSRKKHAIHNVLYDLYGGTPIGNMPDYDIMTEKVNKIYNTPVEFGDIKPRSFLQKVGDICREGYPNCFAEWAIIKSTKLYRSYVSSLEEGQEPSFFCVIISDVRCPNEVSSIQKLPNGRVIYYSATEKTLNERLLKRDGRLPTEEHRLHPTELLSDQIKEKADFIIETDNLTIEQQAEATLSVLGLKEKANA
jgi:dephospho-CoA kinase